MTKIECVIYDIDGTLALTEERNRLVMTHFSAAHYGIDFTKEDWKSLVGSDARGYWQRLKDKGGARFTASFEDYRRDFSSTPLFDKFRAAARPGMVDVIDFHHRRGRKQAAATNAPTGMAERTLKDIKVHDKMGFILCPSDIEATGGKPKPAPDLFLETAARLNVRPSSCLVYEDSRTGVEAALAAGMRVVQVFDHAKDRVDGAHYHAANRKQLWQITTGLSSGSCRP